MRRRRLVLHAGVRLALLYALLFVVSVGILAALLVYTVRTAIEDEVRAQIRSETNLLLFEYREDGLEELLEETEERIEKSRSGHRLSYMVQSPAGRVVFDRVAPATEPYGWRRDDSDPPMLYLFSPLGGGYVLGVGKDLAGVAVVEQAMLRALLWILAAVVVLGTGGGLVLSRRTLAQLDDITRAAREIGDGRLSRRIPLRHNGDELDRLADTLNGMFDRIEHLVANVRHVSTGIAHDLRTPLARLRNHLEVLRTNDDAAAVDADLGAAIAEVDEILQTFGALLRLAEVEAGSLQAGFREVDLAEVVRQVAEAYTAPAEEAGVRLQTTLPAAVPLRGDARLLRQAVANLVENALQHGGSGLTIRVGLEPQGEAAVLVVADDGVGVPAGERERLLEPFARLDASRRDGGSGLGLALVAAIARLHGGDLRLEDNDPGLRCVLSLHRTAAGAVGPHR